MPLSNQKSPPSPDEIEVSIFGPGFGECVVIHAGEGTWLIVDSCLSREAGKPAALAYFDEIGINPANSVELILATHWHDDHVAGIDQVVEACPQAKFWCSDALKCEEFLALLELKLSRRDIKFTRGTLYIGRVVDVIGPAFNFALGGMRIYQRNLTTSGVRVPVEMWALSPSQYENLIAKQNLGSLIVDQTTPEVRIPDRNPNHASVASALIVGDCHILLGADLEELGDARLGWSAVVSNPGRPDLHSSVFKVPHHGSITAHHADTWQQLITRSPYAAVTPYRRGNNVLPQAADIVRIRQHVQSAYITKSRLYQRPRRRSNVVQKLIPASLRAITKIPGHIRLRRSKGGPPSVWNVQLFDGADRLENFHG
jgi:beta-lactamase superfamily II metal-dependent hydrolase